MNTCQIFLNRCVIKNLSLNMYYWAIKHLNECYACCITDIDDNHCTQKYVKYIKMGFNGANNKNLHFSLVSTALQTSWSLKRAQETKWIYTKCLLLVELSECFLLHMKQLPIFNVLSFSNTYAVPQEGTAEQLLNQLFMSVQACM